MENTSNIVAQLDAADINISTSQPQARIPHSVPVDHAHNGQPGPASVPENPFEGTRLPGVAYAVPYEHAVNHSWRLAGARPASRAGSFVYERPAHTGEHKFVVPAVLPDDFRIQSTLLEGEDSDETWRTDLPEFGVPTVFPNLDIILANAQGTPLDFVRCFVDHGWATSTNAIGSMANTVKQHMHRPTVQQRLDDNQERKQILIFDILLSFSQLAAGRKGDTLWLGCPVLPSQLLTIIQGQVARQTGSTWKVPALDQTVKLVGELVKFTDQARVFTRSLVQNRSADWTEVQKLVEQGEEMKESIQMLTALSWEEACHAANSPELPATLNLLNQRESRMAQTQQTHPDRQREGWGLTTSPSGLQGAPTFVLTREPLDGDPKLTPAERDELERVCKEDKTTDIELAKARLLTEATGVSIIALQPGGPDISRVNLSYSAENLIRKVHQEFATDDSLRKIPLVTLVKVFSLRMTAGDNFVFEHLGLLVSQDFSTEVSLTKVRGSTQGAQVIKAKKHGWAAIESMQDLHNVIDGLAKCARRFHHPSILSHQGIFDLGATLMDVFVGHGGHALVTGLFQVFKARIEEHTLAVRARAGESEEPLPPLGQLQARSRMLYDKTCEVAKHQCLRDYTALRTGPGITPWGAQRSTNSSIDAYGRRTPYTHPTKASKQGKPTSNAAGEPKNAQPGPNTGAKRTTDPEPHQGQGRTGNKRTKRASDADNPCVKCGKPGHQYYRCTDGAWCTIPRTWPTFLRSLAEKVRTDNGVTVIYGQSRGQPEAAPGGPNRD